MLVTNIDNRFIQSESPHSLALQNNVTTPAPGFDSMPLIRNQKLFMGAGLQGCGCGCNSKGPCHGISGLSFDGTGLLGTGLFSDDFSTWGIPEIVVSAIGLFAVYSMFHQGKQTQARALSALGRRRRAKASKLRARAKALEEKGTSSFF